MVIRYDCGDYFEQFSLNLVDRVPRSKRQNKGVKETAPLVSTHITTSWYLSILQAPSPEKRITRETHLESHIFTSVQQQK